MDISVSHLNKRMALQVPPELPLGLVFIVGHIHDLREVESPRPMLQLQLRDGQHVIDCRLPRKIAEEALLKEGDRVRMGGQLTFDVQSARYQLLAHHLEVLVSRPQATLPSHDSAGGDRAGRPGMALAPPELPLWVRKLAPLEIQRELGFAVEHLPGDRQPDASRASDSETIAEAQETGLIDDLPPEMVRFLSQAIDSDDDVELTPEMLVSFGAGGRTAGADSGKEARAGRAARTPPRSDIRAPEVRTGRSGAREELAQKVAGWLTSSQLYLIPLLMLLIFLIAMFVFVLFQQ